MSIIDASYFASDDLNVAAKPSGVLYQRQAVNPLNASLANAVNIGTLTFDKTQLDVTAQVMQQNQENYYKFTLQGNSIKLNFVNATGSASLRFQLYDSTGNVVADNYGTSDQIIAYTEMNSLGGLDAKAGDYYAKVSYGGNSLKTIPQTYYLALYSGTHFDNSYQTTVLSQTSNRQTVSVDNTMVYATADALQYTNQQYNRLNATASTAVNIGWLYENKSALSLTSQLTQMNSSEYYGLTLQKGSSLKLAFNNRTNTSDIRVQLIDPTGTSIYADNEGTDAQKAAYQNLTSSGGLTAKTGQYVVKVTYGKNADHTKTQTYNFKVYSGDSYSSIYETTASAESFDTALINGDWEGSLGYNPMVATATYLYNSSQDTPIDIMETLRQVV